MNKIKKISFTLFLALFFLITPGLSIASCPEGLVEDPITKLCTSEESCKNNNEFKSFITGNCLSSYEDWLSEVWGWAMMIIVPLSVLILSAAGVLYMTSEGDSNRIGLAKKLIVGVVSGVGLLVLARLLLIIILGEDFGGGGGIWNVN